MNDLPPPTAVGELIRRVREMAIPKLSRPEVAHRAGIDPGTLGNIERGYRHLGEGRIREVPGDAAHIAKVAQILGISPEQLESEGERPDAAARLRWLLHAPSAPRLVPAPGDPLQISADDSDDEIESKIAGDEMLEFLWRLLDDEGRQLRPRGERIGSMQRWIARTPSGRDEQRNGTTALR